MVIAAPVKPLPLLIPYLDQGTKHYAGKTIDFRGVPFQARVIEWGRVERSFPYPNGLVSIANAYVRCSDHDGQLRTLLHDRTWIRRIFEIAYDFEVNATLPAPDIDYPTPPQEGPVSEPLWSPFFTGEVTGVDGSTMEIGVRLKDITSSWLERKIPFLGIRDHFPNMPDDVEAIFIPIIHGQCYSLTGANLDPEGVIRCHHIDTTLHRYVVARHSCFAVPAVYRKRPLDGRFKLVPPSEYQVIQENKTIFGITYAMTYIQFTARQKDGTIINCDVSGHDGRWDFELGTLIDGIEVRNPVDCLVNQIYFTLLDEVNLQRFDAASFIATRDITEIKNLKCDGAITEQMTSGLAISKMCKSAGIDFFQTNRGKIKIHHFDVENDLGNIAPLDDDMILERTIHPQVPVDKVFNRVRYRYFRQNAGLSTFRQNTKSGNWIKEYTVDNLPDQAEMAATGSNPLLELEVELDFCRDDATAKKVIKTILMYHTLRSYQTTLQLAGPEIINYAGLADIVAVTQVWGFGDGGYTNAVHRIYRIVFDLDSKRATVEAVIPNFISDASLDWSVDDSHPAHQAQIRNPQLATYVNGTTDPANPSRTYPDADVSVNLEDSYEDVITTEFGAAGVPSTIVNNFGFSGIQTQPPPVNSTNSNDVLWSGIKWIEDKVLAPRRVRGFVPIPKNLIQTLIEEIQAGFRLEYGTLFPDTKPSVTASDVGKVAFYSVDFDHLYIYLGAAAGTATGWCGVQYNGGELIFMFKPDNAVATAFLHECNGASGVRTSNFDGTTSLITVPGPDDIDGHFPTISTRTFGFSKVLINNAGNDGGLIPYIRL